MTNGHIDILVGDRRMVAVPHHYEINVSKDGLHLFATAQRSCHDRDDYERVLEIIKQKFPESEGYKVSATAEYQFGMTMNTEEDAE